MKVFARRKKTPAAASRPVDQLDANSMELALLALDTHLSGVADFSEQISKWQAQLDQFIAAGDASDEVAMQAIPVLRSRLEISPNHLQRERERIPALVDALVSAVLAFEGRLVEAGKAEYAALVDALAPAVRNFCASDEEARGVVSGCSIFGAIPTDRRSPLFGAEGGNPGHLYWLLGHPDFVYDRLTNYQRGNILDVLRSRIRSLLAAYALWQGRGGKFADENFHVPSLAPLTGELRHERGTWSKPSDAPQAATA